MPAADKRKSIAFLLCCFNPDLIIFLKAISSTIYKQLLRPYSCAKKLQGQKCDLRKAAQNTFVQKSTHKMLMKLTPIVAQNKAKIAESNPNLMLSIVFYYVIILIHYRLVYIRFHQI